MEVITPPHSIEIEKDVLSVICNRPELIEKVEEILYPDCFYDSDYRFLFETVWSIYCAGKPVTQSAILQMVIPSGKKDILGTYQAMKTYFTSESFLHHNATLLSEYAVKRALLMKSYELQALVKANDPISKFDQLVDVVSEIVTTRNRPIEGFSFSESLQEMDVLMNRPQTVALSGIDTGIKDLNDLTGGWQVDDTVVIAGRPGMGKTVSGCVHAYAAAISGVPVAFVSLEMQKVKLTSRIVSALCNISASDITKGRLAENQKAIVTATRRGIENLPIYYYTPKNSSDINDISLTLRNWKRKFGIGLVIFDYIQLITDRDVRDTSDETKIVTSVQKKLTRLKGYLGIPLIELAQLSRNNESRGNKRPILADLKSSGQIEQDSTIVIFPYRQDYYDSTAANEKGEIFIPSHDLEYGLAKNREGITCTLALKADMATNRIWCPEKW